MTTRNDKNTDKSKDTGRNKQPIDQTQGRDEKLVDENGKPRDPNFHDTDEGGTSLGDVER